MFSDLKSGNSNCRKLEGGDIFVPSQTVDKALLLQGFVIVGTAFLI